MKFKISVFDVIYAIVLFVLFLFILHIGLNTERDRDQYKELWYECVEEKQNLRNKINEDNSDESSERKRYSAEEIARRFDEVTED